MDVLSLRNKKKEQLESTKKGKNRREKMLKGKMTKRDRKVSEIYVQTAGTYTVHLLKKG